MTAKPYAGQKARTTRDASLPQESSENTPCDDCGVRDAEGMNPAGRSLCRPCARREQTLVADGGGVESEFCDAITEARARIRDEPALSDRVTGRVLDILASADAGHKTKGDVLEDLAAQFERRRDQAKLAEKEFAALDEKRAADFQTGRTLAMTDALAAVRAAQRGEEDD
ncbi:hypothetical protein [Halobacterium jilantaiense]|uniref:Uncharacterized protein n=1 Tax=Halobacterium jilantaiense TaxID=355548 RepID=A0A1I0P895_9EURY|nr:hypothetical protein [Halobacterium jilantaiense]SEW10507.1 hypothetical protein SAMN04487945_1477 [Halobacterium jilantaiense]